MGHRRGFELGLDLTPMRWSRFWGPLHSAASIVERLGISGTNLLYRWRQQQVGKAGPVASALDDRVRELEAELRRVERERDILKQALIIFGRAD